MSFSDDALMAKLSALNETQEGIVTVSQWVIFHKRYAERIAQLWLQKLRDSPAAKRLNLIYLANEVTQQSKARRKEDFIIAFSPIIAEAMSVAYKGASNEIQQKLRRVVEVWRQRSIFELPIQEAVEARVDEIDKSRSTGKKPLGLGGSLFANPSGPSTPSELQPLVPLQLALSKSTMASGTSTTSANAEYDKMHDPNYSHPTPPVQAARLSHLLKMLANAENSVSESIKSRRALIEGLEKLLETNRSALTRDESLVARLSERKAETETNKRDVEDGIMKGLSSVENTASNQFGQSGEAAEPIPRPQVEALTPPPVEAITPVGSPKHEPQGFDFSAISQAPAQQGPGPGPGPESGSGSGLGLGPEAANNSTPNPIPTLPGVGVGIGMGQAGNLQLPGVDLSAIAATLNNHQLNTTNTTTTNHNGNTDSNNTNGSTASAKKRKVTHEEEDYAKFAGGDLDADVAELLAQQEGDRQ